MSDGKVIFETLLDESGLLKGLDDIEATAGQKLGVIGSAFERTGGIMTKAFTAPIIGAATAFMGTAEATREYRTEMGKLEAAFTTAGFSAEVAKSAYEDIYAVLGEDDTSVEAANHLAQLTDNEKELAAWTGDILPGVFATFGDSLPLEGLTEAANETAKVKKVTGPLADALNWAGVSEDEFNKKLAACSNEQERQALITETLNDIYGEASDKYKELNGDVMDAQRAQAKLTDAIAKIGEVAEPIMTLLKDKAADLLNVLAGLLDSIASAPGWVQGLVLGFTGVLAAAGPFLVILGKITTGLGNIIDFSARVRTSLLKKAAATSIDTASTTVNTAATSKLGGALKTALTAVGKFVAHIAGKVAALASDTAAMAINTTATKLNGSAASRAGSKVLAFASAHKVAAIASLGLAGGIIALVAYMAKTGASAEDVANKITGFADNLSKMIMEFANQLPSMVETLVPAFTQAIQSIVAVIPTLIPSLIQAGITLFMALVDSLTQIIEPITSALLQIVTAIIGVIPTLIPPLIQAGITLFMALVQAIPTIINALVAAIPQIIAAVVEVLPTLIPALLQGAIQLFMALVQALPTVITALVEAIPQIITAIVSILPTLIPALIEGAVQLFMAFVQAIPQVIQALIAALPTIINSIIAAIPTLVPALIQGAVQLFMAFVQAIPQVIAAFVQALPQIITAIVTGLLSMAGQIFNTGVTLLKKLWSGISSWVGSLGSKVVSFAKTLPGKIKSGIGSLVSVGSDWVKGLWNGIKNVKDWIIGKIKGFGSSCLNAIKDFFGINSPSKVMDQEVGRMLPPGLARGILAKTKVAVAAAKKQMAAVKEAYMSEDMSFDLDPNPNPPVVQAYKARFISDRASISALSAPAKSEPQVEQTINFYSEQKSPIEIGRMLKRQAMFGLAGV